MKTVVQETAMYGTVSSVAINTAAISFGVKIFGAHYPLAKSGAAGFTIVSRGPFHLVQRHRA